MLIGSPVIRPSKDRLRNLALDYEDTIQNATADFGISPAFVLAVIIVESGGRMDAVGYANAGGLMQLIRATA